MTKVAILPVAGNAGEVSYHAVAGDRRSSGRTAGEALDALTAQLSEGESGTVIVIQNSRPDRFFTASQRDRLAELMDRWRAARDRGEALSTDEQAELDSLADAELQAAGQRAASIADELGR